MKHSKHPLTAALSLIFVVSTMSFLSGCSSADEDAETLSKTPRSFAPVPQQVEFDPQESRNAGAWGGVYMTQNELNDTDRNIVDYTAIPSYADDAELSEWKKKFGEQNAFASNDGKKLYHDSCAGCHMHQGEGAYGAGYYPPLADNPKMESKYYILDILINGFRGMPSFRNHLNDEQMAAVTQYVMTDLNGYNEEVTKEDAAQLRPDMAPQEEAVH